MKKLIAVAAMLSSACAFAAHNEFTFDVNSSGANIYVCGFSYNGERALANAKNAGLNGENAADLEYVDSITWSEYLVDDWEGTEKKIGDYSVSNVKDFEKNYARQNVFKDGKYKRIGDLKFNFNSEYYGNTYTVKVCYNVPHWIQGDPKAGGTVPLLIDTATQFTNLVNGRDYIGNVNAAAGTCNEGACVKSKVVVLTWDFVNNLMWGGTETSNDIVNGNSTAELEFIGTPFWNDQNNRVLEVIYDFREMSSARRPHVAHGGHFTLFTDVYPGYRN